MTTPLTKQGPLKGTTIVDLSMWWSGPLATKFFAMMGADVIKVESIQRVDGWRLAVRLMADAGIEASNVFNGVNVNKLGITLDLSSEEGHRILRDLVERADALVENYSPRVMDNLGLGDDVLFRWNPELVILSMPAFGLTGPWRDFVGFAPTIEQFSGLPELTGYEGGPPVLSGNSIADPSAGITGAFALLAGLHAQDRDGGGRHIDLSQLESLTALLGKPLMEQQAKGQPPPRRGNRHAWKAPYGCYPCAEDDTWAVIAVSNDAQWQALCEVMGENALAGDERFRTAASRKGHQDEVDEMVSRWTRERNRHEVAEALQAREVPAAAVYRPSDLLADQHLRERDYFVELDRAEVGRHPHHGLPFQFSRTPGAITRAAPTLGQDNRHVLQDIVGLSDAEIEALEAKQVIGTQPVE